MSQSSLVRFIVCCGDDAGELTVVASIPAIVDVWKDLALQSLVVADANARVHSWKQMLCLSSGPCQEDKDIIKGLKGILEK